MLKYDYTPKQYADKINEYLNISKEEYERIVRNNFELIKKFDRRKIAQDYIDLAYGKVCGEKYDTPPVADPKFVENCESMWNENFREEELSSLESFF